MKTKAELELIKSFIDNTYSRFGMRLLVNTDKKYNPRDPSSALGYCYKYQDAVLGTIVYKIECSKIGIEDTDFRILMHEYGHIYLGHLEGIHEDLDARLWDTLENSREELIAEINQKCGINFADKLLERIIDDPGLNHSLHNIAMDMEVNSSVLSLDDVDAMENDISSVLPKYEEEMLKYIQDNTEDEEVKKQIQDELNRMSSEAKIKLIHPYRYYLDENTPFPDNLTYPEYLILIIQHLDQFVKMLVSLKMGGNGDTSQISQQDIQDALNNILNQLQGKSEAYKQGYRDAIRDMQNQNGGQGQNQQSQGQQQGSQSGNSMPDMSGQQGSQSGQGQPGGSTMQGNQSTGQVGGQGQQGSSPSNQGQGQGSGSGQQGSQQDQDDYNQGYQDALRDMANAQGQGQGSGMQSLSDLMSDLGMTPPSNSGNGDGQGDGNGQPSDSQPGGSGKTGQSKSVAPREDPNQYNYAKDHKTDSRDDADKKRELGQIRSKGGTGCGSSGGPGYTREVEKDLDDVEMALQEVMHNVKKKVVKMATVKDNMKNYNRGVIRSVIAPSFSRKITICNEPKIVYLIDISGSMDTKLIDRCLGTIARSMKKLSRGLKYDIITWSTCLGEHIKDIEPRHPVTRVSGGGGTSIARGIKYFKDNYGPEAILIIISDFEDSLEEWRQVESTMDEYTIYGFDYGCGSYYGDSSKIDWKNLKVRQFKNIKYSD